MSLVEKVKHTLGGPFIRAVGILVGGTVVAQAILAATLPVATRLYSPEDFSTLAVFTGIIAILSVGTCLRFDIAVPLPLKDEDGLAVVVLSLGIAAALNLVLLAATTLFSSTFAAWLGHPELAAYLWLVPVAAFLAGAYNTLQFWFVRRKRFGELARNRVMQAAGSSATQIGLGMTGVAPLGLLLGQLVNSGVGSLRLAWRLWHAERTTIGQIRRHDIARMARQYDRFPKFSTLEAMCNSAAVYLPIILLSAWAVGPEAGYLSLGMYAMQVPMSLIGNAVSQVYMSRGPEEARAGTIGRFTTEVLSGLLKTGIGPIISIGVMAPELFRIVFGSEWSRAGVLVTWMAPWFILQFLASPISLALHIKNRLAEAFALQVFGLALRTGAVTLAAALPNAPLSEFYALSGAAFYLVYLILILNIVEADWKATWLVVLGSLPIAAGWLMLGVAASFALALIF
ncbi:Membrane protein involved in the export of O-antigen and teichoic acid [Devosia lucknowensis]|uniref:Membrane protein involved in the export of O-antigen and teichoic acid n=1 Tax=Devosia lucknowensis TaxID=1096929 RepID=A0A1Y6GAT1_9HYPH|nr:oligosaccharide flippase family protein [Devosia lucknowensis]SMQ85537.1 Membrane protein involved in the export of O-antigen and teichoic acid [Devosia lucknowensis]